MKPRFIALSFFILVLTRTAFLAADERRSVEREMLPQAFAQAAFSTEIPSPSEFTGFEFGSRLWQHHQVVAYFEMLAERSERATWERYATSHQQRPLGYLTLTSTSNQSQLESIRSSHRQLADPTQCDQVDIGSLPAIINAGYGVHGDEPSATHAAILVAYLLAAGEHPLIDQWLEQLVIRIDPCLNPDGFERFSSWSNNYQGLHVNAEPWHREHRQSWPGGRVNNYWFDLNRDWFPLVHPESQGRLQQYHQWRPVLTLDFHEMGTDSTYFFQPGEPNRNHPRSPSGTRELTRELAEYHGRALDQIGTRYFTEERFDDFYAGKGSTYPDLKGSVGILFEQSSARGVVQAGNRGERTLAGTVRNQVATSVSSFLGAYELRVRLLNNVRESYLQAQAAAESELLAGYAFTAAKDPERLSHFAALLAKHEIESSWLRTVTTVRSLQGESMDLAAGTLIVSARQKESRLLRALFDRPTDFEENAFYDVSAWALPLAYDLDEQQLGQLPANELLESEVIWEAPGVDSEEAIAYITAWSPMAAPAELARVMSAGLQVHVASESFTVETVSGRHTYAEGTLAVFAYGADDRLADDQRADDQRAERQNEVREILRQSPALRWRAVKSGLTDNGIDFGSSAWLPLPKPRIAVVVGEGVDRYAAGAVWHHLDQVLGLPTTLIDGGDLALASREDWTAVVVAGGAPAGFDAATKLGVESWMENGGTLVLLGDANAWGASQGWVSLTKASEGSGAGERRPYAAAADDRALERIAGAIVMTKIDLTHPLGWGLSDELLPLFRDHTHYLAPATSPYSTPGVYDSEPVAAGFISTKNRDRLAGAASVVVYGKGRGRVIAIAEQPVYRGFFVGSSRLFDNAVLLGPVIEYR